ncbi:2636_t:CDS:1, partial [Ambispora gerdemannii]
QHGSSLLKTMFYRISFNSRKILALTATPQRLSRKFYTCNGFLYLLRLRKHNSKSLHWHFTRQYETTATSGSINNGRYTKNNYDKTEVETLKKNSEKIKLEAASSSNENQKLVNILRQQVSKKKPLETIWKTYTQTSKKNALNLLTYIDYIDLLTALKTYENDYLVSIFLNKIYDDLRYMRLNLKSQAYNLILHLSGQCGNFKRVEMLLIEMRNRGISADVNTLNSLISTFVHIRRLDWAIPIFREMQHGLVKPNIETYNILLLVSIQECDFKGAHYLLKELEREDIKPDITIYNKLVDAYLKKEDPAGANACLDMMESKGFAPDISTIKTLITQFCEQNSFQPALRLYDKIFKLNLRPDEYIIDSLAACYERSKKDNQKKRKRIISDNK